MPSSCVRDAARALLVCLITGAAALAQQSNVEVRSPSAKLLDTAPGKIVTASVVVANRGSEADEFAERLILPAGWERVAPPDVPFRLEPGEQIVRVLAVAVPAAMRSGHSVLRYVAESRRDPSSSGSFDFAVQITPVDDLEFTVEPRPDVILAGDSVEVKVRVANRGNGPLQVQVTSRSSLGFPVRLAPAAFSLEAGAARELVATVATDKAFSRKANHAATFEVSATSSSGKVLTARGASLAEVIPLVSGDRDPFHHFRAVMRQMVLVETEHPPSLQVELSGSGSLDEAEQHHLDFVVRGPDMQNSSLFGQRDEMGVSYRGPNWGFDAGDRVYSLSPLTQKRSLGRGVGVHWRDGGTSAGAYYMATRFRRSNSEEFGAFLRQQVTEEFSLQANFLRKDGDGLLSNALPQNIASLEARYQLAKLLDLRVEAGASRSDDGKVDFAYRVEARGELPGNLTYAAEHVHAGSEFHGYYHNTDATYASVAKTITPELRGRGSFNRYAGNLALSDIRSTVVNRETSWSAGAAYSLTKNTELTLDWNHLERADILEPVAYDFAEDAARFGASHNFGKLQLQGSLELGVHDNALTGEAGPFQRYNAVVHWRPSPRQTYSVFGRYGPSAFTGSTEQALNFGASGNWQIKDNLDVSASYARNQYDGLTGREQDQALASLRYVFKDKRSFSLLARWSRALGGGGSQRNEAALLATYSVPLSMPVSRKRSIGQLQGRVYDATRGPAAGLPRVVVQVGEDFAVTDSAGFYEFPALKPGAAEIRILQDSLDQNFTMATTLPLKTEISPGDTAFADLKATPAASVAVQVKRYAFADGNAIQTSGALKEDGGFEGAVVEISNGSVVWRAKTDRTGVATFARLAAGQWKLKVVPDALPPLHLLEEPERTLALSPGASRNVSIRLVPQRRTLKLLERGSVR